MAVAAAELDDDDPMKTPPFLYGCHYSTPGFVVYYLLRKDPQVRLRRAPITEGEREYTRSRNQSLKGRENIPVADTGYQH
eukprot:6332719-Pyramimonas_sp.AAC.1